MRRREFIAGLGSAAAWPLAVRAQQGDRVRRIGVLMQGGENDPEMNLRYSAFAQALADLGWTEGRDVRMDLRWGRADINRIRTLAHELVGLQPGIILTNSTPATLALQRATRTIPIVFAAVADPVASGIVARLDRPSDTSPALPPTKPRWEASGLSCSWSSRPGSSERQSCSIPTRLPRLFICPRLRRRPGHSRWRQ
jgi:ABC transporter substrate binding protein